VSAFKNKPIKADEAEHRDVAMIEIIDVLRQEHRNIEKLLRVLERELSVFDRGDRPDYDVVLAVIDYFKDYPDACHHPKEDIIVEKFKARDPVAAATIGDLEAEHREGARRLRRVAQAVESVLSDQEHMAMEERVVFPAVLNALRPEDWTDIALQLADRYGPLSQTNFEEKFSTLRQNTLQMEEDTEAERPH